MDPLDQLVLSAAYPPVEAKAFVALGEDGYWRIFVRVRHESWSWREATTERYDRLTIREAFDVLADLDYLAGQAQGARERD